MNSLDETTVSVEKAISRIEKIGWGISHASNKSSVALMHEFLRRMAEWRKIFDDKPTSPFFDVARRIKTEFKLPKQLIVRLENALRGASPAQAWMCPHYVKWEALPEVDKIAYNHLLSPYEPLIIFLERGGDFNLHHGEIIIGDHTIPAGLWPDYVQSQTLDLAPDKLDALDA